MPMSYDPKTGVPSFNPFETELDEGVTPAYANLGPHENKLDLFKGDPPPGVDRLEMKTFKIKLAPRPKKGEDTIKIKLAPRFKPTPPTTTIEHMADEMLNDVVRKAKPAKLDAHVATDSEIEEVERQVKARAIENWPLLRRLINRLRRAEGK